MYYQIWPLPLMTHGFSVLCFLMHAWSAAVRNRQERLEIKSPYDELVSLTGQQLMRLFGEVP